jgi:hypothetical protein
LIGDVQREDLESMTGVKVQWDGYISLSIPDEWDWEEEDGVISIYNSNGVGAIQISFVESDEPGALFKPEDFVSLFIREQFGFVAPTSIMLGRIPAAYFEGVDNDPEPSYWRVWAAGEKGRGVTISYNCTASDHQLEKAEIDAMINSVDWLF